MPVGQGKIDLKGPIEFEGCLHDENTEVEKEQSCTREVRGTVGSREITHSHSHEGGAGATEREAENIHTTITAERERERTAHKEEPRMERERGLMTA